jgi:regulatory protein SWI6
VDDTQQRIRNLERAIAEEDSFDWTGRTEIDGSPARGEAGPGFTYRGPASTLSNLPTGINIEFDADPMGPTEGASNALVHLMRLEGWYQRVLGLLEERVKGLEGGEAELEARLARVVGRCCGVESERVEGMLEGLLAGL